MIGLGIIPRYAGITRTADHVEWYENVCMLGVFLGSLACLYDGNLPFGVPGLGCLRIVFRNFSSEAGSLRWAKW